MTAIAKLFVDIGSNISGFKSGMNQVHRDIDQTSKKMGFMSNAISTGLGVLAAQAVTKLTLIGKSAVDVGLMFNKLEENSLIAFDTMLGGMDKAKLYMADLKRFAELTPFELPGLITTTQKLLAFGFESEKILPMLTDIGDAVSGLGGSPELLNRITVALGQIRAKGRVQAQEMLQLTEAGIPAWELLANEMGITIPEAMKLSEKGALEANKAIEDLLTGMRGKFGGLMEKQSKTFTGLSSTLNDILRNLSSRLTAPWFEKMKTSLEDTLKILQSEKFEKFFSGLVKGSEAAANAVFKVGKAIASILTGGFSILSIFGGSTDKPKKRILEMFDILGLLDRVLGKFANRRIAFLDNFNVKDVVRSLAGFIDALRGGGKHVEYWLEHMPRVLQPFAKAFEKVYTFIAGKGIQTTLSKVWDIFKGLLKTVSNIVRPLKDAFGSIFGQLMSGESLGFSDIISTLGKGLKDSLGNLYETIKTNLWPTIKSGLVWVWNSVAAFFSDLQWGEIWNSFVTGLTSIKDYVVSIDWGKVWENFLAGISAIGSFLQENVLPHLSTFFSWLTSWFTDPSKRATLSNALLTVWNFIADWGSKFIEWVSPFVTGFWNWLVSWFNTSEKRSILAGYLISSWNFVTEWGSKFIGWIVPPLTTFWNWLISWVTDSEKRNTLLTAISNTWTSFTDWAGKVWDWMKPKLKSMWDNLIAWVSGSETSPTLWERLKSVWQGFTYWASLTWIWMKPKLDEMMTNLRGWINTNYPTFGKWLDQIEKFSIDAAADIKANFPTVVSSFKELGTTIYEEVPKILAELDRLYANMFGQGQGSFFGGFARFTQQITTFIGDTLTMFRMMLEILNSMVESTKRLYSGDFAGWDQSMTDFTNKITELWNFLRSTSQPQDVTGSAVSASSTGNTQNVVINIEAGVRVDEQLYRNLAEKLQRDLNNRGNRVAYSY